MRIAIHLDAGQIFRLTYVRNPWEVQGRKDSIVSRLRASPSP